MEEKESTISGSPENTDSGSPTPMSCSGVGVPLAHGAPTAASHTTRPPSAGVSGDGSSISAAGGIPMAGKKKRGRPRKYDAEGNLNPAYAAAAARKALSPPPVRSSAPPPGFSFTMSSDFEPKRGRGRAAAAAAASGNWHQLGSLGELLANTAGVDFTPHILTVQTGEDVAATILSFSQKGPQGICILSANGAISNVTIRQPGSSGGLLTYEGRFEILSLTGSYTFGESGGVKSRTGGLSISLAGPDGRVVGGSVAGWLIAASPIQVVVGTFMPMAYKTQRRRQPRESPTTMTFPVLPETLTSPTPTSQATPPGTEVGQHVGPHMPTLSHSEPDDSVGSGHNLNVVSSQDTPEWNNGGSTEPSPDQRIYPDINVSVSAL